MLQQLLYIVTSFDIICLYHIMSVQLTYFYILNLNTLLYKIILNAIHSHLQFNFNFYYAAFCSLKGKISEGCKSYLSCNHHSLSQTIMNVFSINLILTKVHVLLMFFSSIHDLIDDEFCFVDTPTFRSFLQDCALKAFLITMRNDVFTFGTLF